MNSCILERSVKASPWQVYSEALKWWHDCFYHSQESFPDWPLRLLLNCYWKAKKLYNNTKSQAALGGRKRCTGFWGAQTCWPFSSLASLSMTGQHNAQSTAQHQEAADPYFAVNMSTCAPRCGHICIKVLSPLHVQSSLMVPFSCGKLFAADNMYKPTETLFSCSF